MLGAGIKVLPFAAASSVEHAVNLLDAKEPFLIQAGLSRLKLLVRFDAAKYKALACSMVPRLLFLAGSDHDCDLRCSALNILAAVVDTSEGMEALLEAGGRTVLRRISEQETGSNEDIRAEAELLLEIASGGGSGTDYRKHKT